MRRLVQALVSISVECTIEHTTWIRLILGFSHIYFDRITAYKGGCGFWFSQISLFLTRPLHNILGTPLFHCVVDSKAEHIYSVVLASYQIYV